MAHLQCAAAANRSISCATDHTTVQGWYQSINTPCGSGRGRKRTPLVTECQSDVVVMTPASTAQAQAPQADSQAGEAAGVAAGTPARGPIGFAGQAPAGPAAAHYFCSRPCTGDLSHIMATGTTHAWCLHQHNLWLAHPKVKCRQCWGGCRIVCAVDVCAASFGWSHV